MAEKTITADICGRRGGATRMPELGVTLSRVASSHSAHATQSLRRMVTHETGGHGVDDLDHLDTDFLDTHDEHHEHEHEHGGEHESGYKRAQEQLSPDRDSPQSFSSHRKSDDGDEKDCSATSDVVGYARNADAQGSDRTEVSGDGEGKAAGDAPPGDGKFALQDQTNLLPMKQVIIVFVGLSCALFCSLLDQTIVTTALPTLGRVFNASEISSWVGTAYMLTSTAFQPLYGRLSDIFGRKVVLLANVLIFLIGSIGASASQTMVQLIIFRAISGIGAGGILTCSLIIIADIVSLKDRGKFQGISGGVVALANSLGPVLGGIFTEKLGWRYCFYIVLPFTGLSLVVIFFVLPLRKVSGSIREKLKKIDYSGAVLTLVWAMLVILALSWAGTTYAWTSAAVLVPLIVGIVLAMFFVVMETKWIPLPLMPMHIFKNATVSASMATTFANGVGFFVTLYYLPQYLQVVRGESPLEAAVDMLPLTFIQTFFVFFSGFMVAKTGDYKWTLLFGFGVWTVGLGLISTVGPTTPKSHIYAFQTVLGLGAGPTFQTSLIAIQASVTRNDMATATGCRNFIRMLGGTVALAISAAIMNNVAHSQLNAAFPPDMVKKILSTPTELAAIGLDDAQIHYVRMAYAKGISGCFYFCIPLSGLSFFITLFWVKRVSLKRGDEAKLKEEAKVWLAERKRGHHAEAADEEKTIGGASGSSSSAPNSELTFTNGDDKDGDVGPSSSSMKGLK